MKPTFLARLFPRTAIVAAAIALAACATKPPAGESLMLTGANEVPAVSTAGTATGSVLIAPDGAVSGTVTAVGFTPTMAHIHIGAPGTNGPVIVPMTQSGNVFTFAPGAKLNDQQLAAYKAGNLYINVHSAAHPGGEVRAWLKGTGS